jgi:thiamine biosynthesis protein ThiS
MNLLLNGERQKVEAKNIRDLVNELGLTPETTLIEHNGTALLRSDWAHTSLTDNDQLEVLRVAAGG